MKTQHKISKAIAICLFTTLLACNKDKVNNPQPVEQELITTMMLHVTDSAGFDKSFVYKVENGFENGTGNIFIDTLRLPANQSFDAEVLLSNDQALPPEDVTAEVLQENTEHLFLFQSTPNAGAGSIIADNGTVDDNGNPFNQKIKITTGALGNGILVITLKHLPTNKNAQTPDAAGGETDAQATFPVSLE